MHSFCKFLVILSLNHKNSHGDAYIHVDNLYMYVIVIYFIRKRVTHVHTNVLIEACI